MAGWEDERSVALPGGVRMPLLGLGTWQATGTQGYEAALRALRLGYRHIDTATMYGNEREVGRALRDSGVSRDEVFLTTKLPPSRAGRERETLADSLRALGVERIDLWLIHWPPRGGAGRETWRRFVEAQSEGLVRAVGVSNYSLAQIEQLAEATGRRPAVNQIPWSPWQFDERLLAGHVELGVALEGYSPFKGSDLRDGLLVEIAAAHGVTPAQVVLRWHIEHRIVVIPKSIHPDRLAANLDVFGFRLSAEEVAAIDALGG
jgi:diketogulonate reductase-like aldo/keto reductase